MPNKIIDNAGAGDFRKNPQNINRKGAPRKSFNTFNLKCEKMGVEKVTREMYFSSVSNIMNLTDKDLRKEMADEKNPRWLRWLIQDLGDKQQRVKIMQDHRDWLFGKAMQKTELTGKEGKDLIPSIQIEIINSADKVKHDSGS